MRGRIIKDNYPIDEDILEPFGFQRERFK